MHAWTDAANLVDKGLPCVVFGAGDLSLAHTPKECIHQSDIFKLQRILTRLLGK